MNTENVCFDPILRLIELYSIYYTTCLIKTSILNIHIWKLKNKFGCPVYVVANIICYYDLNKSRLL